MLQANIASSLSSSAIKFVLLGRSNEQGIVFFIQPAGIYPGIKYSLTSLKLPATSCFKT